MDANIVALSKTIDPLELGPRLRNARLAAGLTQTELAEGYASTGYISRIEAGQRRPDLELLNRLALRLGTTAEELLVGLSRERRAEVQLEIDHAELSLASGNAAEALSQADAILNSLPEGVGLERNVKFVRASALESTGSLDDAILAFEELTDTPPADLLWLRSLIALSRCYRDIGDLAMAIQVGERARATIEEHGLAGLSEAVQLTLTTASAYFERGDASHAVRICKQAVAQAEEFALPTARASAYWNASVMASRQGSVSEALDLAGKAIRIFEWGSDARNAARLHTQFGILQLRLDPPEPAEAKKILERSAREMDWSSASPTDKAQNQLALARANLLLGHVALAEEQAVAGYQVAVDQSPLSAADALVLQGQIAASRGEQGEATHAYRRAIQVLSGVGADRRAAELWFELGGLLQEIGDAEAALDAYRRAAASTGLKSRTSLHALMTSPTADDAETAAEIR